MPEVTITVPAEHIELVRHNTLFIGEELARAIEGDYADAGGRDVDLLLCQLEQGAPARLKSNAALRHVLLACLVDVGGELHDCCLDEPPEVEEIRSAAARAIWLAEAVAGLETTTERSN